MASETGFEEVLPGTRRLFGTDGKPLPGDAHLQKHGDIVLNPQPSNSPNDPLNWSLLRKSWHSALVLFVVALTAATSNDAGSGTDNINAELGISFGAFNTGAGVLFIGIAYWTLLGSPTVYLYGRRFLYLFGMLLGVAGNVWYARIRTTEDSIWSQLFVGASESVAEAVVQLSLLDIWFEHQNGTTLGLYTLATTVGTYLGPLIANYIADSSLNWQWIGWMGAIFSGGTFVLLFFGLEETSFHRDRHFANGERYLMDGVSTTEKNTERDSTTGDNVEPGQTSGSDVVSTSSEQNNAQTTGADLEKGAQPVNNARGRQLSQAERRRASFDYDKKKSYWDHIKIITPAPNLRGVGFKQYFQRLWHTFRVFSFPAVWFGGLQWGMQNVCLTFYITIEEDNWIGPPWNYGNAAVGNMNIPCLIGSTIGCFYGGYCSDKFLIWMTKRHGGVMEAEYRLWLMFLCVVIFPTGMWLLGIGTAQGWSWPVPYVGLGFIGFGYGCAGDLSLTYLADCYPEMVLEGMVGVAVINNTLAMIFTFVASYWIDSSIQNSFIEVGVLTFIVLSLCAPMIYFGKRARRWTRDRYFKFIEIRDGFSK